MSDFIVEITDPLVSILEIDISHTTGVSNIEIERYEAFNIEIVNTEKVLVGDLPDNIPMTKIKKDGLDGIDYYLDHYEFDCGTP
jgi:hypothetical protein